LALIFVGKLTKYSTDMTFLQIQKQLTRKVAKKLIGASRSKQW